MLQMTQPPVSRQIQLLEHDLGVKLLERSGAGVSLTPAGAAFLPEAQDIMRRAQAAASTARRAMRADAGNVTLGYIAAASYRLLPQVLDTLRERLPDVHITLREMQTMDQLDALASDRLDLGIVRPFTPRSFSSVAVLVREPFWLAVPKGHPLAEREAVGWQQLQGEKFIEYCPSETRYIYEQIAGRFRAEGVAPEVVVTVSHTHAVLSMVNAGWGVALVPESAASLGYANVVFRPMLDAAGLHAELHMAWRRDSRKHVLQAVLQVLGCV